MTVTSRPKSWPKHFTPSTRKTVYTSIPKGDKR